MQPNTPSSSSSYTTQEHPPRTDLWWDRIPSLKIVRPPRGPFSHNVDERCLTFCSQTVTGRVQGHDPWCRSLCVRRVFLHEVTRVLSHHQTQTVHREPGKPPRVETTEVVETAPVHHPLPPEGQRYSGWLHALLGRTADSESDPAHRLSDAPGGDDLRYWKAGWYLWWSKSRWAAQERFDLMRRSLESQTEWQRLKERRNEEWAHGAHYDENRYVEDANRVDDLGNMPPFPDVSHESILLPIPDTIALGEQLSNVLAPTWKVLDVVRESVRSGAQAELARRMYDKALTDEPLKLLRICCSLIWENMGFGDDEDGKNGGDTPESSRRKP
ncbi:hypothetical protein C8Q77DRAFT_1212880 [Trametes polyzona]|nr:hypothetical protein C8Q77DRAFT_1212880 [Trametes polyzona]